MENLYYGLYMVDIVQRSHNDDAVVIANQSLSARPRCEQGVVIGLNIGPPNPDPAAALSF